MDVTMLKEVVESYEKVESDGGMTMDERLKLAVEVGLLKADIRQGKFSGMSDAEQEDISQYVSRLGELAANI